MEPDPAVAAVKTYNYLRIALAALVLLLFLSVGVEAAAAGWCLQPSISAYFYTPVGPVLIGVLVTMGACLVALKGNTDEEDVLMNLAGMLAPVVAFVPTPAAGRCLSTAPATPDIPSTVANNLPALLVTGGVVAVVAVALQRRERVRAPTAHGTSRWNRVGVALTATLLGGGAVWFVADRDSFLARGHDAAAVPMFLAVVAVVWFNAQDVERTVRRQASAPPGGRGTMPPSRGRYVPVYRVIAVGMLGALVATVVTSLLTRSTSLVFWVEVVLITLFAVFWVVQTVELWDRGLRGV